LALKIGDLARPGEQEGEQGALTRACTSHMINDNRILVNFVELRMKYTLELLSTIDAGNTSWASLCEDDDLSDLMQMEFQVLSADWVKWWSMLLVKVRELEKPWLRQWVPGQERALPGPIRDLDFRDLPAGP
jgi:hypothetical protein